MAGIVFQGARIAGVGYRMADGKPHVRVKVVATALEDLAVRLAVPWMLRSNGQLLAELEQGAAVTHEVQKIHKLEAKARYVGKFRAYRESDDAPAVGISFIVLLSGQAFEVLEHLLRVGESAGQCSIEPLQRSLIDGVH